MSVNHSAMKLGKSKPRYDKRTLLFADYIDPKFLPTIPPAYDWGGGDALNFGMMLNDNLGDCTCAAKGHQIQVMTRQALGKEITVPDSAVLAAYEACGQYVPGNPSTDNGANMLDVLNYCRQTGIGGHKDLAFVALEPGNLDHVRAAIYLFGGVYTGMGLPITAQTQSVWSVVPNAGADGQQYSWGGHATWTLKYDSGAFSTITWGARKLLTPNFWHMYVDEAYAVLSQDWLNSLSMSPSGFNLDQLKSDLQDVTK